MIVFPPLASVPSNHSTGCVCFPQRRSVSIVCRHQRRVQSQLHFSKEKKTQISVPLRSVQVSHHDVGGHPGPAFATDLGDSTSPAEHPHLAACCSVRAKDVQRTATAETAGGGQWQAEAAQQQHLERLRINSHDFVNWERRGRKPSDQFGIGLMPASTVSMVATPLLLCDRC